MFKDYGDWGSYKGGLDMSGKRDGQGKMTYDSSNYYNGGFLNDKFHGDKGVYHWNDGDEYEGSWKDGERHGAGIFRSADGTVDYSTYEMGSHVGEGVTWSPDRKTAHKTLDGKKKSEMLPEEAEGMAREKFGWGVPPPLEVPAQSAASSSPTKSIGLLARLFSSKRVGPDGKPMFKDYGDWGTYEGDLDDDGNRHGKGKMTYDSGNTYEGTFQNGKFHGDKGTYNWSDGDEYVGPWKDGERHGNGSFLNADGTMEYSAYENGQAKGEGVKISPDRKVAHKLEDGAEKIEMLIEEAAKIVTEKFGLSVPAPHVAKPAL